MAVAAAASEQVVTGAPRRAWLAVLLSLLAAGVGHVYAGAPRRGAGAWVLSVITLVVGLPVAMRLPPIAQLALLGCLLVAVPVAVASDAVRVARRQGAAFVPRRYNRWYVYAGLIGLWVFLLQPQLTALLKAHIAEAFRIPSGAMEPTILTRDYILATRIRRSATRGEVVVHRSALGTFVKRVVGIPGDTIAMRAGQVLINGHEVVEPYVLPEQADIEAPEFAWQRDFLATGVISSEYRPTLRTWGPLIVPTDQYFLLGDNRGMSLDSRYLGMVPRAAIFARPTVVYFSRDPATGSVRWSRIGQKAG